MPTGSETVNSGETRITTKALAMRILNPWVAGDKQRLEFELRNWKRRHGVDADDEPDGGCRELLDCLVEQMAGEADLWATRSEKMHLGVWVDLLTHLADPELGRQVALG